jgi:hypothetical protein
LWQIDLAPFTLHNGPSAGVTAMGLFTSVIHVHDRRQHEVKGELLTLLRLSGLTVSPSEKLSARPSLPDGDELLYLVSPLQGRWCTIIQSHISTQRSPWLSDVSRSLSASLETHSLALMVHDDDVLYYNLCFSGSDIDGYNSDPQYFESKCLSDDEIRQQRHAPQHFATLLPEGVFISDMEAVLRKGWWAAYEGGKLDADGVPPREECHYISEGERMIAVGNLLQLHGLAHGYPYAGWANSQIDWTLFTAVRARKI